MTGAFQEGAQPPVGLGSGRFTAYQDARFLQWAAKYNAYERLAAGPRHLEALLSGVRDEYRRTGLVHEGMGVDLLRGWAFYLFRRDHHVGGDTLDGEWRAVVEAVRSHPHAKRRDLPPSVGTDG